MTQPQRDATLSIRAFNIELAKVKSLANSQEAGEMRMYFWKSVVNECFQGV
jgi:hypothetical protein